MIDTDSGERGIPGGIGSSPDGRAHTYVYAGVDDLQRYCQLAESLGGTVVMPPTQVAGTTKIAVFLDTQGNAFGMYEGM